MRRGMPIPAMNASKAVRRTRAGRSSAPATGARLRGGVAAFAFAAVAGLCWLAPVATTPAFAQGAQTIKVGFVRTEKILRESNLAKAAQQKIEKDFARRDKELQDTAARLKGMSDKFEKEAAVMSETDRNRRQREIAELDKEFQRKQREFREDLNQRRNEDLAIVLEKANAAIKQIADEDKYDLILQEAVHVSPRIDITDRVIKALNGPN